MPMRMPMWDKWPFATAPLRRRIDRFLRLIRPSRLGRVCVLQVLDEPACFRIGADLIETDNLRRVFSVEMHYAGAVEALARGYLWGRRITDKGIGDCFAFPEMTPDKACQRVTREVREAALEIRRRARQSGHWTPDMEDRARVWMLTRHGPMRRALFSDPSETSRVA
jgi:hypothetical protein